MSTRTNDLAGDREQQRQQWDRVAAGWKKWWPTIEDGARGVSKRMVELAEVGPGKRVLDIATGIGEPALLAASLVGPAGRVVATDLSPRMLDIARARTTAAGLANVEFVQQDAQRLDFDEDSFDAVLWRWGPTDLPEPSGAFLAIRRMLVPDGCFAASVWQSGPKARPLASLALTVAREMFDLPPVDSEEQAPVADDLRRDLVLAGFPDVRIEEVALTLTFASAEDCTQYLLDVSPMFTELLSDKSPAQQAEYRHRLAAKLGRYVAADGSVRIPNLTLCAAARKR